MIKDYYIVVGIGWLNICLGLCLHNLVQIVIKTEVTRFLWEINCTPNIM